MMLVKVGSIVKVGHMVSSLATTLLLIWLKCPMIKQCLTNGVK